jgi:hypothetical protein
MTKNYVNLTSRGVNVDALKNTITMSGTVPNGFDLESGPYTTTTQISYAGNYTYTMYTVEGGVSYIHTGIMNVTKGGSTFTASVTANSVASNEIYLSVSSAGYFTVNGVGSASSAIPFTCTVTLIN